LVERLKAVSPYLLYVNEGRTGVATIRRSIEQTLPIKYLIA
jgi:hypothetical protein